MFRLIILVNIYIYIHFICCVAVVEKKLKAANELSENFEVCVLFLFIIHEHNKLNNTIKKSKPTLIIAERSPLRLIYHERFDLFYSN